jgi:hypothetical protein
MEFKGKKLVTVYLAPTKFNEDATCGVCISGRRRRINHTRIFLIATLIFLGHLPTATGNLQLCFVFPCSVLSCVWNLTNGIPFICSEGFQRYNLHEAANELQAPRYQVQILQALAAQEAHEAARFKVLWPTAAVVLFLAFLFGNIMGMYLNGILPLRYTHAFDIYLTC